MLVRLLVGLWFKAIWQTRLLWNKKKGYLEVEWVQYWFSEKDRICKKELSSGINLSAVKLGRELVHTVGQVPLLSVLGNLF